MKSKSIDLGQKIKRYRLVNDIRQEDMAEKMGVSRATLINYEKGHTVINIEVLSRFKKLYPDFDNSENRDGKPKILIDNSIDFRVLISVLLQKKIYIFTISFLFAVVGFSLSYLFTNTYKAEISLYPAKNDNIQGISQFQSLAANLGMNTNNSDQEFNISDVVMSRLIAGKVVRQNWFMKNGEKIDLPTLWKINRPSRINFFNQINIDSTINLEKAVKKIKKHIQVREDNLSGLIRITTTFQDPILASAIANYIGSQVETYIQKENSAQSTKEKLFISDRLSIVKFELEKSELDLKDFKERNRGYQDSPELFMIYSQLFREVEAKKQVYLTLQQQLELARIEEVKRSPILHILDYAVPPIRKSHPNRILFLVSSLIIGMIFASLRTVFRY